MSAFTEIAYEKRGPVRIIRFNRPQVRNCIGAVTHRELVEAWTQFRDDESALVAIITGTGEKSFSTGGDLKPDLKPQAPSEIAAHDRGERPGVLGPSRWTDIQAHYRRSEWYGVCGRPRMGVFRGYPDSGGTRLIRRHMPPLEHWTRRWRHSAAAADRRNGASDGNYHHRTGRRRGRSPSYRIGQ
jgi:hypothetical protein